MKEWVHIITLQILCLQQEVDALKFLIKTLIYLWLSLLGLHKISMRGWPVHFCSPFLLNIILSGTLGFGSVDGSFIGGYSLTVLMKSVMSTSSLLRFAWLTLLRHRSSNLRSVTFKKLLQASSERQVKTWGRVFVHGRVSTDSLRAYKSWVQGRE